MIAEVRSIADDTAKRKGLVKKVFVGVGYWVSKETEFGKGGVVERSLE